MQIKQLAVEKLKLTSRQQNSEVEIINQWALKKNMVLHERVGLIERKLEAFIREKTGKDDWICRMVHLKMHKKPEKVEISDLNTFLANAKARNANNYSGTDKA